MASFQATIARHQAMVEQLLSLEKTISCFADHVATTLQQGSTVLLFGNGGSAADAQHLAAEFVVRYHQQRPAFAAIASVSIKSTSSGLRAISTPPGPAPPGPGGIGGRAPDILACPRS